MVIRGNKPVLLKTKRKDQNTLELGVHPSCPIDCNWRDVGGFRYHGEKILSEKWMGLITETLVSKIELQLFHTGMNLFLCEMLHWFE